MSSSRQVAFGHHLSNFDPIKLLIRIVTWIDEGNSCREMFTQTSGKSLKRKKITTCNTVVYNKNVNFVFQIFKVLPPKSLENNIRSTALSCYLPLKPSRPCQAPEAPLVLKATSSLANLPSAINP
ncbi:hypothetical protein CEXT_314691 [Caerostris extrusa]|uniref:Uncharacterized protein n=1 Tax=Caerostris extrusa TaxID=172846 RepID=A0AAV4Q418_CAEEX|nr:hypothetical protein CEXT_314691 [Caerostris extrusa]